jgi:flagellar motility protein MotE (MotC chaperone)
MFGKKAEGISQEEHNKIVTDIEHRNDMKVEHLKSDHALALKEKEFELKHFKDAKVQELESENGKLNQRIAVLEKENEMLGKVTDLNGDIIDIKSLVNKLIEKLPNIDIKSLSLNGSSGNTKE